ncbi:MAG: hypothetical protein AAFZ87_04365 [Planctomycetota bacterium]
MQRPHKHNDRRTGLIARTARRVGGSTGPAAWSLVAILAVAGTSAAFDVDPDTSKFGADPTVGTLPMVGGSPAFDQALTLRGPVSDVRSAIRDAFQLDGSNVSAEVEVTDLGGGEVWVRFYGDLALDLDLDSLVNVELGLFAGFEGDGMGFVVEATPSAAPISGLLPGYELPIETLRLFDAGLFDGQVVLRAVHRAGNTSLVGFDFDPATLRLRITQDV